MASSSLPCPCCSFSRAGDNLWATRAAQAGPDLAESSWFSRWVSPPEEAGKASGAKGKERVGCSVFCRGTGLGRHAEHPCCCQVQMHSHSSMCSEVLALAIVGDTKAPAPQSLLQPPCTRHSSHTGGNPANAEGRALCTGQE